MKNPLSWLWRKIRPPVEPPPPAPETELIPLVTHDIVTEHGKTYIQVVLVQAAGTNQRLVQFWMKHGPLGARNICVVLDAAACPGIRAAMTKFADYAAKDQ